MSFYYALIAGFCILWLLLWIGGRSRVKDAVFLAVAFLALAGLSAIRYDVGFDYTYIYAPQYEELLTRPGYTFSDTRFEPGFVALEFLIALFSKNYHMLFVVTSVLIIGLMMLFYWKSSPNVFVSVFLFLTLSQYYCSMNFVRQTLAAAIALFGIPLLAKRKPLPFLLYLLLVGVASLFHQSALILIPLGFVNLLPLNNKFVLAGFSLAAIGMYLTVTPIIGFVTRYWFTHYEDNHNVTATFDFRFTAFSLVWLLLLLFGSRILTRENKENYIYINYAFFAFFFVLLGTRHSILDRFSVLFMLATPVGVARLLDQLKQRADQALQKQEDWPLYSKRRAQSSAVVAVVFVSALLIHHASLSLDHHGVRPYRIIFDQPFYQEYKEWIAKDWSDDDEMPALEPPDIPSASEGSGSGADDTGDPMPPADPDPTGQDASSDPSDQPPSPVSSLEELF